MRHHPEQRLGCPICKDEPEPQPPLPQGEGEPEPWRLKPRLWAFRHHVRLRGRLEIALRSEPAHAGFVANGPQARIHSPAP